MVCRFAVVSSGTVEEEKEVAEFAKEEQEARSRGQLLLVSSGVELMHFSAADFRLIMLLLLYTSSARLGSLLLSTVGGRSAAVGGGGGKDSGTKCQLDRMLLLLRLLAARMGAMVLLLRGTFGGHRYECFGSD